MDRWFSMNGGKGSRQFRITFAIIVLSVLVIFPNGTPMARDTTLVPQDGGAYESSISEDAFDNISPDNTILNTDPNYFTQNLGQWEDHIRYLGETSFGHVALGDNCVYYYLVLRGEGHSIKITFQNSQSATPVGLGELGFESNYFLGNDETKWMTKVKSFDRVMYKDAWPGIDIIYYFKNGDLKYDILVGEYAFVSEISFIVDGAKDLILKENELEILVTPDVRIMDSNLLAYYSNGERIPCTFQDLGDHSFGFQMNKIYGRALTIDPIVFLSSSFLGGSSMEKAQDLEYDSGGNLVILADTMSQDFPNTTGAYNTNLTGSQDMVITKMDPNATSLIFSTFIGGWSYDFPSALDLDDLDYIYATGETWATDFPTTNGSFQDEPPPGSTNPFVVKLSPSGSDLIYSTFVGSSMPDWAEDIKVQNGYANVVGYSYSYDFPYVDYPINNAHGTVFYFILNQDGTNLTHTAFWGGHQNEIAYSLDMDDNGDVVVGGVTNSVDFPVTSGAYQENTTDSSNGFLLRYSPSSSTLLFSTYIGGSAYDEIRSIYKDDNDDIYFAGITNNPEGSGDIPFPTTPGAYDRTYNGSSDTFIGKMSGDGTTLIYSTLYGSEGEETVGSIDVDSQGNVYLIGSLNSDVNFSVTPDAFDFTFNQGDDVVFAVLNPFGTEITYSTYIGGNVSDLGKTCLLSESGEIHLLGTTSSMDFPSTDGSFQTETDGSGDLFISKLKIGNYIYLYEGWNLISVPLIPWDHDLEIVLSSIKGSYDAVQWYDITESSDHWKHYHIQKPQQLNDLEDLDHRMGFWIHISKPGGVLYEYSGDPLVLPEMIPLDKGWNAVGWPSLSSYNRIAGLNNLGYGTEVDAIQWYDAKDDTWHSMGPSDYFKRGVGYFIHAKVGCVWEVPL
jgi:hypothetical protein